MDAEKGSFVPVAFFSFLCYNACDSLKEEARITAIENGERITRGLEDGPRRVLSWLELDPWPDEIRSLPLFQNEAAGFSGPSRVRPGEGKRTLRGQSPTSRQALRAVPG